MKVTTDKVLKEVRDFRSSYRHFAVTPENARVHERRESEMMRHIDALVECLEAETSTSDATQPKRDDEDASLRDIFAGLALVGLIPAWGMPTQNRDSIVSEAFLVADAMMKARTAHLQVDVFEEPIDWTKTPHAFNHSGDFICNTCNLYPYQSRFHTTMPLPSDPHEFTTAGNGICVVCGSLKDQNTAHSNEAKKPPIPCQCGALPSDPVHDPKYGSHEYQIGPHKFTGAVVGAGGMGEVYLEEYCQNCTSPKSDEIHTLKGQPQQ